MGALINDLAGTVLDGEPSPQWALDLGHDKVYAMSGEEALDLIEEYVARAREIVASAPEE